MLFSARKDCLLFPPEVEMGKETKWRMRVKTQGDDRKGG